jgi:hypothetical protein
MQISYTNDNNTMIMARLEQGESITNFHGPTIIHIPVDPNNAQYSEIVKRELKIDKYETPPAPPTIQQPTTNINELFGKIKAIEVRLAAIEARLPALDKSKNEHITH